MPISIDEEFDEEPEESAFVWADDDSEPEEKPVIELQPKPQPKPQGSFKNVITVSEWQQMADPERKNVFDSAPQNTKYGWNETNDNIEWASWSWNPLTGCLHNCAYCYARDIANHYFTHLDHTGDRFTPVFYPDRLYSPSNAKSPNLDAITDPIERMAKRNVFVCSMADLFGKWVPTEWINAVLQQAWDNPQWTFLFLTKFPIRMAEFEYPSNTWIGTTVDSQHAVERAEKAFQKVRDGGYEGVAWLSCEPMMERLTFSKINLFDWVVVGGSSKSTQTAEFKPPIEWTFHLWEQAKNHGLPFYMKTNLGVENESRHREYPVGKQGENNG
jgi:protein gp37